MDEKKALQTFCDLQTCSDKRLQKIKTTIFNCQKRINKDITKLELIDITKFLRDLNNSDYSAWTKNDYKKIFKAFIKFYYKKNYLEWIENKNIQEGFKCTSKKRAFNKEKINKHTLLKPEELEKLLRATNNLKWKALITLMYESAFRPCEIVRLRWKDLQFEDDKGICSVTTISPKTKEKRDVPVKDCVMHLKRWRDEYSFTNRKDNDYVFPNPTNREAHITEGGLALKLKRICEKAKIRHLYPYIFRHSRIYFIQKNLGSRLASKYAGHSLETSEIYNHLDSDDVEEAMLEKVYATEEIPEDLREKLQKKIKDQDKKIDELTKHFSHYQDLLNDLAEGSLNPIKIEKQDQSKSKEIKEKLMQRYQ